jgi:hypothetical protein
VPNRCSLLAAVAAPPALVGPVIRAVGIAVPTNQGSSSSLLAAVVEPPVQVGPVMRALVTARPADMPDPSGSDPPGRAPDQAVRSVGDMAGGSAEVVLSGWGEAS